MHFVVQNGLLELIRSPLSLLELICLPLGSGEFGHFRLIGILPYLLLWSLPQHAFL